MIFDKLQNLSRYSTIPNLREILDFISKNDLSKLPIGEIPIKGKNLFARVLKYVPAQAQDNKFETHRHYMDVQVIVNGVEKMQVVRPENLQSLGAYDEKGDYEFFSAQKDVSDIIIRDQEFLVFAPGEPHKPGCRHQDLDETVQKVVFKTRVTRK